MIYSSTKKFTEPEKLDGISETSSNSDEKCSNSKGRGHSSTTSGQMQCMTNTLLSHVCSFPRYKLNWTGDKRFDCIFHKDQGQVKKHVATGKKNKRSRKVYIYFDLDLRRKGVCLYVSPTQRTRAMPDEPAAINAWQMEHILIVGQLPHHFSSLEVLKLQ